MLVTKLIGAPKTSDASFSSTVLLLNGDVYTNFTSTDISNSQLQLTPTGMPQSSQFTPFDGNTYSIKFKTARGDAGVNDFLRINGNVLEMGKSDWTMECFFQPVFEVEDNSSILKNDNFRWGFDNQNMFITVNTVANDDTSRITVGNFPHGMIPNQWFHLAVVNSQGNINFYVNGQLLGTDVNHAIPGAGITNYVTIGTLNGYLSQLRVVQNAVIYYGSKFDVPTAPLTNQLGQPAVANYIDPNATVSLLCCQSKTLVDNSGLSNTITGAGNPVITDSNPFLNSYEDFINNSHSTYFHNNLKLWTTSLSQNYGYGIPLVVIMMEGLGDTNDFTMETWAYQSSNDTTVKLPLWFFTERYKGNNGSSLNSGNFLHIYLLQGRLWLQTGADTYADTSTGFAHPSPGQVGVWNHVAFVRSAGNYYLFFNGVMSPVTNGSLSHITHLGPRFLVATDNSADKLTGRIFSRGDGKITNMRIIKDQALFTDDFTVSTLPLRKDTVGHSGNFTKRALTGKVLFLGFQNAALKDNSGLNAQIGFGGIIPYYQYPALTDAGTKASYVPRQANTTDITFSDNNAYGTGRPLVWFAPAGGTSINHMQPGVQLSTLINPSFTMEAWVYGAATYMISGGSGIYNTYNRSSGENGYPYANGPDLYPYMWYWKVGEFSWLEQKDYLQPDYTQTSTSVEFINNAWVTVPGAAGNLGSGSWTLELWWQANGMQHDNATIVGKDSGATNYSWNLKITYPVTGQTSGIPGLQFNYYNNGSWYNIGTSLHLCDNINDGSWHHIAVTRNSNILTIFLDGFVVTTGSDLPANFNFGTSIVNPVNIGYNSIDTSTSYISGKISNLRIVTGAALYATPIDIYTGQAAFVPPSSDLAVVTGTGISTILLWAQGATPLVDNANSYTVTYNNLPHPVANTTGPWTPVNYKFARSTRNYANLGISVDSNNLVTTSWNHVAVSVSAGTVTMYLNGQPDTMTGNLNISQIAQKDPLGDNLVLGSVWKQYGNYSSQVPTTNMRITRNQGMFTGAFTTSTAVLTKTTVGHTGTGAAASLTGNVMLLLTDSNIDSSDSKIVWNFNTFALGIPSTQASGKNFAQYPATIYAGNSQFGIPFKYNNSQLPQGNYSNWLPANSAIYTTSGIGALNPAVFNFGDFNIEFWVWLRANPVQGSTRTIMSTNSLINGSNTWEIVVDPAGNLVFSSYGKQIFSFPVYSKYNTDNWNHMLISRRSLTICFYINGQQVYQAPQDTVSWYLWPDNSLYLGYNPQSAYPGYSGTVALHDVRIVKGQALVSSAAAIPELTTAVPFSVDANTVVLAANASSISAPLSNNGAISSFNTFNYNSNNIIWYFGSSTHNTDSFSVTDKQDEKGNYVLQFGANKDWTMEAWIYPLGYNTGQIQVIASKFTANSPNTPTTGTGWIWFLTASGGLQFQDNSVLAKADSAIPTLNTWNHVAVSYYRDTVANKNYFYMFLNGVTVFDPNTRASAFSVSNPTIFTHQDNTGTLNLGTLIDSASFQNISGFSYTTSKYNFNGYINNFRVIKNQALYKAVSNTPYQISNANIATTSGKTVVNFNIGTNQVTDVGDNQSAVNLSGNVRVYTNVAYNQGNLIATGNALNFYGLRDTTAQGDAAGNRGFVYLEPNKSNYQITDKGFTIQLWVQHNNNGQNRTIISYGYYGQSHVFKLYLTTANNVGMSWRTNTDGTNTTVPTSDYKDVPGLTTTPLTAGTWYNLVLVNEAGTATFFVNGVATWHAPFADDSGSLIPILWNTNTPLPVGSAGNYSWYFHNWNNSNYSTTDFLKLTQPAVTSPADIKSGSYNFGLENFTMESWIYNTTDNTNPPNQPTIWQTSPNNTYQSIDTTVWPNYSSPMPAAHNGGKYSVYIDGTANSNIMFTPGANFNFGTGDFTIEYWSLLASDYGDVLSSNTSNWGLIYYSAQLYMQNKYYTANTHNIAYPYTDGLKLRNGSWHHYAYVKTAGKFNIYIDGTQILSETDTTNYGTGYDSAAPWYIGYNPNTGVGYGSPVGYYSNFRVANVAVYTGNFTPPLADLAKTGSGSAGAYEYTANVNTTFTSVNCLLLTFQGSSISDASDFSVVNNLTVNTLPGINSQALGGTVTTSGLYTIHQFTTGTNVTFQNPTTADILIVGAGGGGGGCIAGGGGGGGVIYLPGTAINAGTHTVYVSGGGAGGQYYGTGDGEAGGRGSNSYVQFNSTLGSTKYEVWGGGGGGSYTSGGGAYEATLFYNGGSGGGASASSNQYQSWDQNGNPVAGGGAGIALITTYGSVSSMGYRGAGYSGPGNPIFACGGGGAGGYGIYSTSSVPGDGGIGFQSDISGSSTYYAGGGGGGARQGGFGGDGWNSYSGTVNRVSNGGLGGGGNGTYDSAYYAAAARDYNIYNGGNQNVLPPPYTPNLGRFPPYLAAQGGAANTGGGGGGGGYRYNPYGQAGGRPGGSGGSGVVFIRYLTNNNAVYNDPQIRVVEKHYTDPDYYNLDITNSTSTSYYFGPSNAILTVTGSANSGNWDLSNSSWTFECWIKLNEEGVGTNRTILTRRANSNTITNTDYWFGISSDANRLMMSKGAAGTLTTNYSVVVEKWTHIAFCYDGTNTIGIYADGQKLYGDSGTIFVNTTNPGTSVSIGGNANGSQPLQGYISNLRYTRGQVLYSGTLTDRFTPSTAPLTTSSVGSTGTAAAGSLTGTVTLLTAQDTLYKDNSSNNYTLTSNKGAFSRHVTSQNPVGAPDNALQFYSDYSGRVNLYTLSVANKQLNGTRPVKHNAWQHVAIVKYNNYIKTYVDGNLDINYAMTRTENRSPMNSASELMMVFNTGGINSEPESGNGMTGWISGMRFSKKALYTTKNFLPLPYHSTSQPQIGNISNVSTSEVSLLIANTSSFTNYSINAGQVFINGAPFVGQFNNNDGSVTPPNGPWYTWFMGSGFGNWKDTGYYDFRGNIAAFAVNNFPAITYNKSFTVPTAAFVNNTVGTAIGEGVASQLTGNVSLLTATTDPTQQMDQGLYNLDVKVYGAPTASQILNQFNAPTTGAYSISVSNGTSADLTASSNYVFGSGADFTIEFWMFVNNVTGYQVLLDQYQDNTTGSGNWRVAVSNGQIIWNYDGKNYIRTGSSSAVNSNSWTHVALQRRSGNLKILINGADTWWTAQDAGWPYAGGNLIANSSYVIHQFTTSTTWYIPDTVTADILVIAGGGAGGHRIGGGGGAGGVSYRTGQTLTPGVYNIVVGAGGKWATSSNGNNGTDSGFTGGSTSITATGGGGGAKYDAGAVGSGGSGGGGAQTLGGGTGINGQGNAGGGAYGSAPGTVAYGAGGGGGAGSAGETGGTRGTTSGYSGGGHGGAGILNSITGTPVYYAGGGGGGSYYGRGIAAGGIGGGGAGATYAPAYYSIHAINGVPFTGSGGGGGGESPANAANGASGIVIVRYPRTNSLTYPVATFTGQHGRTDIPVRLGNAQTSGTGISLSGYISNLRISKIARYTSNTGNFVPYTGNLNIANTLHTGNSVSANITGNVFLTATASTLIDVGTNKLKLSVLSDNKNSVDNLPVVMTTLPYKPAVVLANGYQSVTYTNSNLTITNGSLSDSQLYDFGKNDFTVEYWMYPTKGNAAIFNTWGSTATNGYGLSLVSLPYSISALNADTLSNAGVIFYPIIGKTLKLTVTGNIIAEMVLAGGGGGGGAGAWTSTPYGGGGGGGGGVVHNSNIALQTGNLLVVIGAGGSGASTGQSAGAGSNTYLQSIDMPNFNTIYANGGGAGGDSLSTLGTSGGSGGGGVAAIALAYSQSLPGQGYNGGIADTTYGGGGGGGGAGGRGFDGRLGDGGAGGLGYQSYIGTVPVYFAAGGGGGGGYSPAGAARNHFGFGGAAGLGGVGTGGGVDGAGGGVIITQPNAINAGGGGGGGAPSSGSTTIRPGGNGGYGLVQIKFTPVTYLQLDNYINGQRQSMIANVMPVMNTWNHVAVTQHNQTTSIWLNGQFAGNTATPITHNYTPGAHLMIGSDQTGNVGNFGGQIADLRIVKGQSLYNTSFAPPVKPLSSVQNVNMSDNVVQPVTQILAAQQPYLMNEYNNASPYSTSVYLDGNCWIEFDLAVPLGTQDFTLEFWALNLNTGTDGFTEVTPAVAIGTPAATYVVGTQLAVIPPQNQQKLSSIYWPRNFTATTAPTYEGEAGWPPGYYASNPAPTWHHIMVVRQWNQARTNSFLTVYTDGFVGGNYTTDNAGNANFNLAGTKIRIGRDFAQYDHVNKTPYNNNGGNFRGKITNVRLAYHAVVQNPSVASPKDAGTGSGQVFVPSQHPLDPHLAGHMPLSTTVIRDIPAGRCGLLTAQTSDLADRGDYALTATLKGTSTPVFDTNYLYPFSSDIINSASNNTGPYPNVSAVSPFGVSNNNYGSVYWSSKASTCYYSGSYIPAFQMGTNDYTFETWVYPTDTTDGNNGICNLL